MSLTNKTPSDTYKDLLYVNNSNAGISSTEKVVVSGSGTNSTIKLSDRAMTVQPTEDTTSTFLVTDSGGSQKLLVDTTNDYVKANGVHVNTQYAFFGISSLSSGSLANTHYFMPHDRGVQVALVDIGTGTDPSLTFTTAETSTQRASELTPMLMYLPDAISIDSVTSLEGADTATGDTTRMHLMSYTFTSGSTSCLTSGTLLAHNSDVTNAGSEQAYKSTWTVDSAAVTSGKVICATFRSDSVNSDYSATMVIKYHITG